MLNQQRAKLLAQLKERPDNAGSIAAEAKDAITALSKRLKAVSDKKKYTDLPDELRDEQVSVINTHLAEFRAIRSRALSVQMRGGRKEDLTDILNRASSEHGYDDVKAGDRAWRKAQDLVTIHETVLNTLEMEITGTRNVVQKMFSGRPDVRWGKGVHQKVFLEYNAKAKEKYSDFKAYAPRLTETTIKMREQKEKWSAEPDPKARENLLREYDAYLLSAIQLMEAILIALRETARAGYVVTSGSISENAAYEKIWSAIGADKSARGYALAGLDDDGGAVAAD